MNVPTIKLVSFGFLLVLTLFLALTHPWWFMGLFVLALVIGRLLPGTSLFHKVLEREESFDLATELPVSEIALIFRDTLSAASKHVKFADFRSASNGPFDQFETQPDFAVSASVIRKFNRTNSWLLRLFVVDDESDGRYVVIQVVGSPKWARAIAGRGSTFSIGQGLDQAERVRNRLRAADPNLELVNESLAIMSEDLM